VTVCGIDVDAAWTMVLDHKVLQAAQEPQVVTKKNR
jgi:hypothetical protein